MRDLIPVLLASISLGALSGCEPEGKPMVVDCGNYSVQVGVGYRTDFAQVPKSTLDGYCNDLRTIGEKVTKPTYVMVPTPPSLYEALVSPSPD